MPTVKEYTNEKGYYIRSNIDGRYVTLQLSPEAEGLFSDFGFSGGEQISWQLLKPLCNTGHAYTNNSGTAVETDEVNADVSVSSKDLSSERKRRLEEFLEQHTPDSSVPEGDGPERNGEKKQSKPDNIGSLKRGFIEKWSPSDDEYEGTLNRIARVDDVDGILKSVAHHSTEHPILVERFRINSRDVPTYSFETDGIPWTVHDFRTIDTTTDAELFFDIRPGTSRSQSITVEPETVEWHTMGEQFTREQISEFLTVAPDILYYINHLVSSPNIDPEDITSNPTAKMNPEDAARIDPFESLESVDPDKYDRALGTPLSLGDSGYGRIRGHTGHTFSFSQEDAEEDDIEPGDIISFELKTRKDSVRAKNIQEEDIEISSSEITRNWYKWHDRSLSWFRDTWTEQQTEQDTDKVPISIGDADNKDDLQCIDVEIDALTFYSANSPDEVSELLDEATRTLLKQTIDGETVDFRTPIVTNNIEVLISSNILSIIDSVVASSSVYETRDQFFTAALQDHLGEDMVEMTIQIPRRYRNVTQQLAEEKEVSTTAFVTEALEEAITTEMDSNQHIGSGK